MPVKESFSPKFGIWVRRFFIGLATVAFGVVLWASFTREGQNRQSAKENSASLQETHALLKETRDLLEHMCAYQRSGTIEGNKRYKFTVFLANGLRKFQLIAAKGREQSALLEAGNNPKQAQADLELANSYRTQAASIAVQLLTIAPRPNLTCPNV